MTALPPHKKPHLLQGDILHLFSDLIHLSPEIVIYPDYTIETPVGFFKLAYSDSTHTSALFYSRHADNLTGDEDVPGEIARKEFLYLIGMHKHYHSRDGRWDKQDDRRQLDLTWVPAAIHNLLYRLPRTALREAALHKVSNDYVSTFAVYEPEAEENGEQRINISTKTGEKFHFITSAHRPKGAGRIQQLLKRMSPEFNLSASIDPSTRQRSYTFAEEDVIEAVIADFHARLLQIWKGDDPVSWREHAITPVARAAEALKNKAIELAEEPREHLLRHFAEMALHTVLAGPLGTLETLLIQRSAGVGELKLRGVTPEWHGIAEGHFKRFKTIESTLHELLIQPEVTKFGDLKWMTPDRDKVSFSKAVPVCNADQERKFRVWLKSQLLSPYASVFQYWPENDGAHSTQHVKAVLSSSSNGVQIFYVPGKNHIYAYYNCPDNRIRNRNLQPDAAQFFDAGIVLKFNMADMGETLTRLSFAEFQAEFLNLTGMNRANFPKSQEPPRSLIAEDPRLTELDRHFR